jgi:murein DD-endopeptidase MepM/ murein hydrolase activator NlpD
LIKSFGQKGRGVNHSGINIQLPVNAPIYAAESGTVLYSDDGLAQYGNLILVKHLNGYVTAYAHNSKNLVKRRQKVAKGDLIAFAGNTGNVEKSQLHFEVRKNTQPINPLKVLPKN